MRLYRKRRREGMRLVRIPLHVTEIDDLIRMGRLNEDQRHDAEALQAAVLGLVQMALDEMSLSRFVRSALFAPCPLRFNLKEICQPKLVLQNREQTEQFPLVSFGM